MEAETSLRDGYWAAPPKLPDGLALERLEPLAITRPGRGGTSVFDLLNLTTATDRITLLASYRTRLLAGQVEALKNRLLSIARQRRERSSAAGHTLREILPVIITDVAKPSVIEACRRAGVGVLDQRGTIVVVGPGVFVHVEGRGSVERPWRGRLFAGKASRIVRFLLAEVAIESIPSPRKAQAFASACELSYASTHGVLTKLERDGYVSRRSSHSGFRLAAPLALLQAWIASGERSYAALEPFNAPATRRSTFAAGAQRLRASSSNLLLFSLASALDADETHVAGLPHGAYWTGELAPLVEALGLRRTTPHNFLVLRPDPVVWTEAGGLLMPDRQRPELAEGLRRVALPQLAADFASLPGRGREQADFLCGLYADRLPYRMEEGR